MSLAWHPHALFIVVFLFFGLVTVLVNFFTVRRLERKYGEAFVREEYERLK